MRHVKFLDSRPKPVQFQRTEQAPTQEMLPLAEPPPAITVPPPQQHVNPLRGLLIAVIEVLNGTRSSTQLQPWITESCRQQLVALKEEVRSGFTIHKVRSQQSERRIEGTAHCTLNGRHCVAVVVQERINDRWVATQFSVVLPQRPLLAAS